jgi:hypothetical protein
VIKETSKIPKYAGVKKKRKEKERKRKKKFNLIFPGSYTTPSEIHQRTSIQNYGQFQCNIHIICETTKYGDSQKKKKKASQIVPLLHKQDQRYTSHGTDEKLSTEQKTKKRKEKKTAAFLDEMASQI